MEYLSRNGEVEITGISDFDPVKMFECGQCFRWDADDHGVYTGVALGRAAKLRREGDSIFLTASTEDFNAVWRSYFDLDRDYAEIRRRLGIDDFMRKATDFGAGIRILRQDCWEALCSFIISQCNNIPRIKKIVAALCSEFGDRFGFDGGEFYTFPSAERLAGLDEEDLAPIRCGYRAAYIIAAARAVADGTLDLDALSQRSSDNARAALKTINGVGNKVADCAVLFGLHMLDAFPRDVWMNRAVAKHYGSGFDPAVFAPYAGIAQQYMFYYMRSGEA